MKQTNTMVSTLALVYPPVSNQEAEWVKSDPEVEKELRRSDFYFIAARAETTFEFISQDDDGLIHLTLSADNGLEDEVILDGRLLAEALDLDPEIITFTFGPKIIRFFSGTKEEVDSGTADLFQWFTTEKLIHDRSRDVPGIMEFNRFREFATYELLYVGIAKTTDTFDRLFAGAHKTRQRILSNEWPRRSNARVTDELYLFALRIEPVIFRTLGTNDALSNITPDALDKHRKTIVIDAEKAFVHLLDPEYNIEKFASYPKSTDGLYTHGYDRYGFVLGENLTFTTSKYSLRGSAPTSLDLHYDHADMLVVNGDTVEFHDALN